ncbi:type II secretion system protein E [Iodidimonas nitroreducens]|uniref:Type II secretion system protein E n=1 Tax=Iodidimonas nitroreducens TaxID=1236968 RepID=A0A5A7N927_9PROT|nr:CpaF family protein [Iodidimonas nitroreducens]GAK34368.1 putative conjugal transfer proteinc/MT3759 [alpha proteobacterium Q-1]GER03920.1 type II secretion system protein E [Iodidimonas nitroreducens]
MKQSTPFARRHLSARKSLSSGFGRANGEPADADSAALAAINRPADPASAPSSGAGGGESPSLDDLSDVLLVRIKSHFTPEEVRMSSRVDLAQNVETYVREIAQELGHAIDDADVRDLGTFLLNELILSAGNTDDPLDGKAPKSAKTDTVLHAKEMVQPLLMEHIDPQAASELPRAELADQVGDVVGELLVQEKINLNLREQRDLVTLLLNDMLGLGPLEPLLADDEVSDIMVNGPQQVYIERKGKLELTDVTFRDNRHLLNIAQRIVTAVGRRVDETSPICDARLMDGSRVNVIIPPLAIDGASISIRKFAKQKITLDAMLNFGSLSPKVAQVLKIAGACRLNILISGGTGSGKTTMLNAVSQLIDRGERVVTIEDAAELQMQQPHVVRLETRPANLEGKGEINMRDLVKNALRMRPDRIILGEIRGGEAIDMLQAMNTGHDGSMGTIHANRPREALTRLENMVNMAGLNLPTKAIREQIAAALDLIIQVSRMRDGGRRTVYVTEVVGMEGDVITTQDLYRFEWKGQDEQGKLQGDWVSSGVRPHFMARAEYFGLGRALMQAMS